MKNRKNKALLTSGIVMLSLFAGLPVMADDVMDLEDALQCTNGEKQYIIDQADLLTEAEEAELESQAEKMYQAYNCGVYVVAVQDYYESGQFTIDDYADYLYGNITMAEGAGANAEIFILSFEDRDYSIYTNGDFAKEAIGDYPKSEIEDQALPYLSDGEYYDGFSKYMQLSEGFLESAANGEAVHASEGEDAVMKILGILLRFVLFPFGLAICICLILKAKMKSVKAATEVRSYILENESAITRRSDRFTHVTTTRRKIESEHHTSGGGTSRSGKF